MREWFKLSLTAQKERLTEAKSIGIHAVSMSSRQLSETEWVVVTDLSQAEYQYSKMLTQIDLYSRGHHSGRGVVFVGITALQFYITLWYSERPERFWIQNLLGSCLAAQK